MKEKNKDKINCTTTNKTLLRGKNQQINLTLNRSSEAFYNLKCILIVPKP